jgi:dihydrofolate reductase
MIISLIVACAQDSNGKYVIGKDGEIPWYYPHDLERFKEHTQRNAIIMGRKTHESIGRLLPKRDNIVLTTQEGYIVPGGYVFHELRGALRFAGERHSEAFIIGGQQLYEQTINRADRLYITTFAIPGITGDTFFPKYDTSQFKCIHTERTDSDYFVILERKENAGANDPYGGYSSYGEFVSACGSNLYAGGI